MTSLDHTFRFSYDVEVLRELPPGQMRRFYYPGASSEGGSDGVLLRVRPESQDARPWIGIFAFGLLSPKGLTGLFTHPDRGKLCVVARGSAYIVDVDNPSDYCIVESEPVFHVCPNREANLLIFADFLRVVAYGSHGLAWKTARVSWDGIEIHRFTKDFLYGAAWSAPLNRQVQFVVDLKTGEHKHCGVD